MEVITPNTLKEALSKFRERGDEKWVDEEELEAQAKGIVDDYLEESAGLTPGDITDITDILVDD